MHKLFRKIKQIGIRDCLVLLKHIFCERLDKYAFYFCAAIFPIKKNRILFESEGDYSDNSQALYQYMIDNHFSDRYEMIWLADNPKYTRNFWGNIKVVSKRWGRLHIITSFYLATCRLYIYNHNNMYGSLPKRDGQFVIFLTHGFGYKANAKVDMDGGKADALDIMIVTGELPLEGLTRFWNVPAEKTKIIGYPRLDYFFSNLSRIKLRVEKKYGFSKYKKVILWMPTFRKSTNKNISEDYLDNETELPLFNTWDEVREFDSFLREKNVLTVLKVHHLHAGIPVCGDCFTNILVLYDQELSLLQIQLYQFIALTDGLITDYSSVSVDFMLLDRPIIYTLDDYEEYNKSRGIWPEHATDYMKGYQVYNVKELRCAITDIANGFDRFQDERNKSMGVFHEHVDGKASERIVDFLDL